MLVEDHQMFREWLGRIISEDGAYTVCGEADNIQAAFTLIQQTHPDIVILDITLRGASGLELLKDLKAQEIDVPVLVLSMHDESLYAERVLRAGARGYITKHAASSTLLKAIEHVLGGGVYLDEEMTAVVLQRLAKPGTRKSWGMEALADRELEVFQLIGKGRTSREIAKLLGLGETTIDTYRARIKEKLNLKSASELCSFAAQWLHEHGA
jgi:DNA-binding NarL/FixJ family response regulator